MEPNLKSWRALSGLLLATLIISCAGDGTYKADGRPNVHVAFLTDCTPYSDWQTITMAWSFKQSGQPGPVTRVMCCTEDEYKKYNKDVLNYVQTHVAPSYTVHPETGDAYLAYNKPGAVVDWLAHVTPEEEWLVILDSDMILRHPFSPDIMKPEKGLAVSASYTYMIGVDNELATTHIPEVLPRNDTLAGPYGRRGDQVGGFFLMHRDDMKRVAPLWLKYTGDVRQDPEAYHLTGDAYAKKPGQKAWISEMYGYSYGAAKADVWHKWDNTSMIYPGYQPEAIPRLLHYGLDYTIELANGTYEYDKHWHYHFNVSQCPPWELTQKPTGGIFQAPPHPRELDKSKDWIQWYTDLVAIQVVATMNSAMCDFHRLHCPPSEQLTSVCDAADKLYEDIMEELEMAEAIFNCVDTMKKCQEWQQQGFCEVDVKFMSKRCKVSCKLCDQQRMLAEASSKAMLRKRHAVDKQKEPKVQADTTATVTTAPPTSIPATTTTTATTSPPTTGTPAVNTQTQSHSTATEATTTAASPPITLDTKAIGNEGTAGEHDNIKRHAVVSEDQAAQMRQLARRCHQIHELTVAEVKECLRQARLGKVYRAAMETGQGAHIDPLEEAKSTVEGTSHQVETLGAQSIGNIISTKDALEMTNHARHSLILWAIILVVCFVVVQKLVMRKKHHRGAARKPAEKLWSQ